ncbi:hypothetical protein ACIA8R_39575 [Nonomuraea sp. NPDC051191]|uniref:hypothetical protein n=1 Tax=Nonomuraea sp. NPDC051191 TaxID=3364372 RepID=UPI00379E1E1B
MAIPKKGSRLITVDGTVFRWRVRHKPTYDEGMAWSPLSFAVERAEEPGAVLMVSLPYARPDNWLGERAIAIRPALVVGCIRRAASASDPSFPFLRGMIPQGDGIEDFARRLGTVGVGIVLVGDLPQIRPRHHARQAAAA